MATSQFSNKFLLTFWKLIRSCSLILIIGMHYWHSICFAENLNSDWPSVKNWGLPFILDDNNTHIRFEVDSTWHTVKGAVSGVSGKVWLQDSGDFTSVLSDIKIPVGKFDTENSSRDERMREVMAEDRFPVVTLSLQRLNGECSPKQIMNGVPCDCSLNAILGIRDVTKRVDMPCSMRRISPREAQLTGSYSLSWAEYHVEDPSIFIARLDPVVTIYYQTLIPLQLED